MMKPWDPQYTSSDVAEAAGMSPANFRANLSRGHWRMIGKPREANGYGHLFTINDALAFALARELVNCGVDPKEAFESAVQDFAFFSDHDDRVPGEVFDPAKFGTTFFLYFPGAKRGRCTASNLERSMVDLLTPPVSHPAGSAILIDCNKLQARVYQALNFDPGKYE